MSVFFKSKWHHFLSVIIIISLSLYNKYPLVFSDSGSYIDSSYTFDTPIDRPLGYGIFIHLFSWRHTMLPVVIGQGAIASFLIWNIILLTLPKLKERFIKMLYITLSVILVLASSLSWYVNQIMPDIFISLGTLVIVILFLKQNISVWKYIFLVFILFFCFASHLSHFLILALSVITFLLLHKNKSSFKEIKSKRLKLNLGLILILGIASITFMTLTNYSKHGQLKPTNGTNVFILGRLAESGNLERYLKEHCNENTILSNLCVSNPKSPSELLWSENGIIHYYDLNWIKADSAAKIIVNDILTTPKYLFPFIYDCLRNTFVQLFQFKIGSGLANYNETSGPYSAINNYFWAERNYFLSTEQSFGLLYLPFFNALNFFLILISVLIYAYGFIYSKLTNYEILIFRFLIITYFYNALITATFANIYDRLQARISWPLVFLALLILTRMLYQHFQHEKIER